MKDIADSYPADMPTLIQPFNCAGLNGTYSFRSTSVQLTPITAALDQSRGNGLREPATFSLVASTQVHSAPLSIATDTSEEYWFVGQCQADRFTVVKAGSHASDGDEVASKWKSEFYSAQNGDLIVYMSYGSEWCGLFCLGEAATKKGTWLQFKRIR